MTDHEKNGHIGDDVYGIDWVCPPLASLQNMQMQIKGRKAVIFSLE